jgi:ATP-dependent helicase/nuclease subunit A
LIDSNFDLKVKVTDINEAEETEVSVDSEAECPVDFDLLGTIKDRAEYVYPYDELSTVLAKINASSVENHIASRSFFASKKPKFLENNVTGATKGTVVHKFLELCDFKKANENLDEEIERLNKEFKLTETETALIDKTKIVEFFNCDITKRLLKAETVYKEYEFSILKSAGEFYKDLSDDLKNEKIVVQGKFDCAFLEPDGAVLIDYKTDKITDENTLVSIYKGQLDIYKSALEECTGVNVKEVYLYSFKLGKFIPVKE